MCPSAPVESGKPVHYTPDEEWWAECGGGADGDGATLNPDLVTCRGCLTMVAVAHEIEGP